MSVADDVVSGDEGGSVSVGDQLSLIGSDRAGLLDVLDLHVAVSDGGFRRHRPDVSFPRVPSINLVGMVVIMAPLSRTAVGSSGPVRTS